MDLDFDFYLRMSLILLVFLICFFFRRENMRKKD